MPSINPKIAVLAITVTTITACGAWVGANLEESQKVKKIQDEGLPLKISRLRSTREALVARRDEIESKIRSFQQQQQQQQHQEQQ
ncbi:hypothetical protein TWF192_005095 [Orbilia oligospora]|nr:hypothetical protein TWF679_002889 [Orbilia oligospora]KAF3222761.1 hypothetical protein TWF191_006579 [Orbilia oligospora]KAF3230122.1 hypothetical protein TWF192_005095 [Orbilia oligospora]